MSRTRATRVSVRRTVAAATTVLAIAAPGTWVAVAPTTARAARPAARVLGAGQTGSRAEVPWHQIGPGWALVTYTTAAPFATLQHPGRTWVYLIDPDGGKYSLYQTGSATIRLVAWSGDTRRALLYVAAKSGTTAIDQLTLATGRLTRIPLPTGMWPVSYTRPDGTSLLAIRYSGRGDSHTELARYTLSGKLEKRLATIPYGDGLFAQYSPDGQTIAITRTQPNGIDLVANASGAVTKLPAADGCSLGGWWNPATLLTISCSDQQMYLAPADGGRPRLLFRATPKAPVSALAGARRLASGIYVEGAAACTDVISKLEHGRLEDIEIDDHALVGSILAASPSRLLLTLGNCGNSTWLASYDPAANSERTFLVPPQTEWGVTSSVPYYTTDGQL
jgi:hypothetical protein